MIRDDELFDRFRAAGDVRALGVLFDRVAPTLLRVARHLARDEAAAEDLVQVTFLRAIEAREQWDAGRPLLPWLFGILQNRARQARARDERALEPEQPEGPLSRERDPERSAEHAELAAAVDSAIAELPPAYHPVLRLYLAYGHSPSAIAHALDRSPGTVRSQLARGLERLRRRLPTGIAGAAAAALSSGRGLGAVKQVVLAHVAPIAAGASSGVPFAGAALAAVVLVALGTAAWLLGPPRSERARTAVDLPALATAPPETDAARDPQGAREPARTAAARPTRPATGVLRVHCHWEDDGSPAAGVLLDVLPSDAGGGVWSRQSATTDLDGRVELPDLPAGRAHVVADRGAWITTEVRAGEAAEASLALPAGVSLAGRVIDEDGRPVPAASVWLSTHGDLFCGRHVASADSAGRFGLRCLQPGSHVSADAPGYRAAAVARIEGEPGSEAALELVLPSAGATLVGTIVDPGGGLVSGARVMVGESVPARESASLQRRPPLLVTSDERGTFRVDGLRPASDVPVWVAARGSAPWMQRVALEESSETAVTIALEEGGRLAGRVTDGNGIPVAGAFVTYRRAAWVPAPSEPWAHPVPEGSYATAFSDESGHYSVEHVPSGALLLLAGANRVEARGEALVSPGRTTTWDPRLVALAIGGRVVDERGAPLRGVRVTCEPERGAGQVRSALTDEEGRFVCEGLYRASHVIVVHAPGDALGARAAARVREVVPPRSDLEVRVADEAVPSAWLRGTLLDAGGRALQEAEVACSAEGLDWEPSGAVDASSGRFELGPLPPGTYRLQPRVGRGGPLCGWSEPIVLHRGEARDVGILRLSEPGRIAVSVSGPDGEPLDGASVALEIDSGWSASLLGASETVGGRAGIADVEPGDYRVRAAAAGLPEAYAPVAVLSGAEVEVRIALARGVECRLVLSSPSEGAPIRERFAWARDGELHERWDNLWESSAERTLPMCLAPGDWQVTITSETGRQAITRFRVALEDPGAEILVRLP